MLLGELHGNLLRAKNPERAATAFHTAAFRIKEELGESQLWVSMMLRACEEYGKAGQYELAYDAAMELSPLKHALLFQDTAMVECSVHAHQFTASLKAAKTDESFVRLMRLAEACRHDDRCAGKLLTLDSIGGKLRENMQKVVAGVEEERFEAVRNLLFNVHGTLIYWKEEGLCTDEEGKSIGDLYAQTAELVVGEPPFVSDHIRQSIEDLIVVFNDVVSELFGVNPYLDLRNEEQVKAGNESLRKYRQKEIDWVLIRCDRFTEVVDRIVDEAGIVTEGERETLEGMKTCLFNVQAQLAVMERPSFSVVEKYKSDLIRVRGDLAGMMDDAEFAEDMGCDALAAVEDFIGRYHGLLERNEKRMDNIVAAAEFIYGKKGFFPRSQKEWLRQVTVRIKREKLKRYTYEGVVRQYSRILGCEEILLRGVVDTLMAEKIVERQAIMATKADLKAIVFKYYPGWKAKKEEEVRKRKKEQERERERIKKAHEEWERIECIRQMEWERKMAEERSNRPWWVKLLDFLIP